jgi:hypothetical protein
VGHLHQNNWTVDVIDLSFLTGTTGTEVSGVVGLNMLSQLEIKLDYRDGLVDFIYPKAQGAEH